MRSKTERNAFSFIRTVLTVLVLSGLVAGFAYTSQVISFAQVDKTGSQKTTKTESQKPKPTGQLARLAEVLQGPIRVDPRVARAHGHGGDPPGQQ